MIRSIAYRAVAVHALLYVVLNGLLLFGWSRLAGEDATFWPAWVLAGWGAALALHAGITATVLVRRRRRRRDEQPAPTPDGATPWVAVMFVDLVGSTRLSESLGDDAWSVMITRFRRIVREVVARHGGAEVGTQGDGSLLRFDSPADAVRCAGELREELNRSREAGEIPTEARMGMHAGRVVERDDDLLGKVVNVASRVADAAGPGEILMTEAVSDHVGPEVSAEDRGLVELKGIDGARHLLALRT